MKVVEDYLTSIFNKKIDIILDEQFLINHFGEELWGLIRVLIKEVNNENNKRVYKGNENNCK